MLTEGGRWPPELDAVEAFGDRNTHNEGGGGGAHKVHWGAISGNSGDGAGDGAAAAGVAGDWAQVPADIYAGFHTYGVDLEADRITWYFDRQPIGTAPTPADFHAPFYLIVDLAVGGGWAEAPTPVSFPAHLLVDYVRVYRAFPGPLPGIGAGAINSAGVAAAAASSSTTAAAAAGTGR
jgi:beta-glucanase (GH16 family)